jgi:nicotinate dehydrogenase subunit A
VARCSAASAIAEAAVPGYEARDGSQPGASRYQRHRQRGTSRMVVEVKQTITLRVNGVARTLEADPNTPLLDVLRGTLGLTAAHFGCGENQCGACHVLIDDHALPACDTPLWSAVGKDITTVEGLGTPERPHALQRAFIAEQAAQCGYCTSGILISAAALLKRRPEPNEAEVRAALDRNLCRCGAHNRIVRAVLRAARETRAP